MSNTNSVIPYLGATLLELADSLGITQFPSQFEWYQLIGGLQVQGSTAAVTGGATLAIAFPAPFQKQVLGIFIQVVGAAANTGYITAVTLNGFDLVNGVGDRSYYWWAIGV